MKKYWLAIILASQQVLLPLAQAQSNDAFSIKHEDPTFKSGSVYYSANKKNDLVIRTNIWGGVQFPGVHYVPSGTKFLEAVSIAGGPIDHADITHITLTSRDSSQPSGILLTKISLQQAMAQPDLNPTLKPDDIIMINQDHTIENTQFWLSIGTFVLSGLALGILIHNTNK